MPEGCLFIMTNYDYRCLQFEKHFYMKLIEYHTKKWTKHSCKGNLCVIKIETKMVMLKNCQYIVTANL